MSWETSEEEELARFVVEAGEDEDSFADIVAVAPQGPATPYEVGVEGDFEVFRLRIENTDGSVDFSDVVSYEVPALPGDLRFAPNFPNPFGERGTTLGFDLPEAMDVTVDVLDLEGRPVTTIFDGERAAGSHATVWEPGDELVGGFYRTRLIAGGDTLTGTAVYAGFDYRFDSELRVIATLGQTDDMGRFATDNRALFPQRYPDLEAEFRSEDNVYLGVIRPSDSVTIILRNGASREQRYERTLDGETNRYELTWDPE